MSDAQPLYVFVHLSKTGGTTLYHHLRGCFASEDELVYLGPEGDNERARLGRPPLEARPEGERRRVRVLIGHRVRLSTLDLLPWREPRLVFFMREPAARLISKYNYQMFLKRRTDEPEPFERWLANLKPNAWDSCFWLCRRFMEMPARALREPDKRRRMADGLLEQFYLVSTTERMDEDVKPLFREMNVPIEMARANVGGRDHKPALVADAALKDRVRAAVAGEEEFYRAWAARAPHWGAAGRPRVPAEDVPGL